MAVATKYRLGVATAILLESIHEESTRYFFLAAFFLATFFFAGAFLATFFLATFFFVAMFFFPPFGAPRVRIIFDPPGGSLYRARADRPSTATMTRFTSELCISKEPLHWCQTRRLMSPRQCN